MDPTALLPLRFRATNSYRPYNPSSSAGIEPVTLGSTGKHDNHQTIENDLRGLPLVLILSFDSPAFDLLSIR
jgi:hypothetical protein